MACKWLQKEETSRVGYICGFYGPCPFLDEPEFPCPCINYARAFEAACKNPDTIERESRMLRDTI